MAIGGHDDFPWGFPRSAEVLTTSCEFPLPDARHSPIGFTTTDDKTLVCGSNDSDLQASCFQFDYGSKTWNNHSPLLEPRDGASAVVLPDGVYVLGI